MVWLLGFVSECMVFKINAKSYTNLPPGTAEGLFWNSQCCPAHWKQAWCANYYNISNTPCNTPILK